MAEKLGPPARLMRVVGLKACGRLFCRHNAKPMLTDGWKKSILPMYSHSRCLKVQVGVSGRNDPRLEIYDAKLACMCTLRH